jgi:hypothetical protein
MYSTSGKNPSHGILGVEGESSCAGDFLYVSQALGICGVRAE